MNRFRISWRALSTGYLGHGQYIPIARDELLAYVDTLNANYRGVLEHWVEPEPDSESTAGATFTPTS